MTELVIRRGLEEPDTSGEFVPHKPARPEKSMGGKAFKLVSNYEPAGDQPTAIKELVSTATQGEQTQVLLGVTGSGKTFTMAKMIEELQRPALVLAPNKILAAQKPGEHEFSPIYGGHRPLDQIVTPAAPPRGDCVRD